MFLKPCLEINYPARLKEEKWYLNFLKSVSYCWGILLIYKQISENSLIELLYDMNKWNCKQNTKGN